MFQKGVAIIVDNNIGEKVTEIERHGDRIIMVKVKACWHAGIHANI